MPAWLILYLPAVACSYDRYVQNWISLAYQKQFSCKNFPSGPICSGGPAVLTVKCQHRFNLQWIHRDTYWRLKALYYFTFAIALDSWIFQSILITTGENFYWLLASGRWQIAKSLCDQKPIFKAKFMRVFYLGPGAKNIDDRKKHKRTLRRSSTMAGIYVQEF